MIWPMPRVYLTRQELEGKWFLALLGLRLVLLVLLGMAAYAITVSGIDTLQAYRADVMIEALQSQYGNSWMAPAFIDDAQHSGHAPSVIQAQLGLLAALASWVTLTGWALHCAGVTDSHRHIRWIVGAMLVLIVMVSVYVSGGELHAAYKIHLLQELDFLDSVYQATGVAPDQWQRGWDDLVSRPEWQALGQETQTQLITLREDNARAVAYLQSAVWQAPPYQWIAWLFQVDPIDTALWPVAPTVTVREAPQPFSVLMYLLGAVCLAMFAALLWAYQQTTKSTRMLDALVAYGNDPHTAGLQSIEGIVQRTEEADLTGGKQVPPVATLQGALKSSNQHGPAPLARITPMILTSAQGSVFSVKAVHQTMRVSLDGAIFFPARTRISDTSHGRDVSINVGDYLWIAGYSHTDPRSPQITSFENSGRESTQAMDSALMATIGLPGTLLVTHYPPSDIKRIISNYGGACMAASLLAGVAGFLLLLSAWSGLGPTTLVYASLGVVTTSLLARATHDLLLLKTKTGFRRLVREQMQRYCRSRQAVVASLQDVSAPQGPTSTEQRQQIRKVMDAIKQGMEAPEHVAQANSTDAHIDALLALHRDLEAIKGPANIWPRAIQVLATDISRMRQHQQAIVRSDALVQAHSVPLAWRAVSWWIKRQPRP